MRNNKRKKTNPIVITLVSAILSLLAGTTLILLYFFLPYFGEEAHRTAASVDFWAGAILFAVGAIAAVTSFGLWQLRDDEPNTERQQTSVAVRPAPTEKRSRAEQPIALVRVGKQQTADEKFEQISKMDRTQFVIYVARLFSRKGYQVKLTPVIDNHGIDLLAEQNGYTFAVGCLIADRVLNKADVARVSDGMRYYDVNGCMALTNVYFDRSAVDFAKIERMTLVDRNILYNEFIA